MDPTKSNIPSEPNRITPEVSSTNALSASQFTPPRSHSQLRLQQVPISGRAFCIQFQEIVSEFGCYIPWLSPLARLPLSTSDKFFTEQLVEGLWLADDSEIVPYQLVKDSPSREFVGGVLHLRKAPEVFKDRRNQDISERLAAEDFDYLTCLQLREDSPSRTAGPVLIESAISTILSSGRKVWGVVSSRRHMQMYCHLGGKLLNDPDNDDRLYMVSFRREDFTPRMTLSKTLRRGPAT